MNQLMQPAGNALMPAQQPMQQPQQQFTPQQVEEGHQHLTDMQNELGKLIRLPDSELNLNAVYNGAADLINTYKLSDGKRGVDSKAIALELSGPDFPTKENGVDPSAQMIRKYLQNHFDRYVMMQANMTHKFGPPQQQNTGAPNA